MKVLLLSKGRLNYTTQRLVEEFEKKEHEVDVVNYLKCYVSIETGKESVRYKGNVVEGYDVVIARTSHRYTGYATSILRQFELQGVYVAPRSLALTRARDKLRSIQILSRAGVAIPKTIFANESADVMDIIHQVGGAPVVIKTVSGTHGRGVVLAETTKAAKAVMQAFYVEGVDFLVQEFIEEAKGADIRAFVLGNSVVAAMERQSLDGEFRSNFHLGGSAQNIQLSSGERKIAIQAAKALGLSICGVDMVRSKDGLKVLEVNASPGFELLEKTSKVNVAKSIVEFVEKNYLQQKKDLVGT